MTSEKLSRFWLPAIIVLILIIIISGTVILLNRDKGKPIIIEEAPADSPSESIQGYIHLDGAVAHPGSYPLKSDDTLSDIIAAGGGLKETADTSSIRLYIPDSEFSIGKQKININTSDAWLLESLPGIGTTRAEAIINYRLNNGNFKCIEDIMNVPGIGISTFEGIKDSITVTE
jgi:competence protein ComEA